MWYEDTGKDNTKYACIRVYSFPQKIKRQTKNNASHAFFFPSENFNSAFSNLWMTSFGRDEKEIWPDHSEIWTLDRHNLHGKKDQ